MGRKERAMENLVSTPFDKTYLNKKVLITGNTGFKGSWLTLWLKLLGAEVYGFSKDIPTNPSMFASLNIEGLINHRYGDVVDKDAFDEFFKEVKPDIVFHLAAQAIVSTSYESPFDTVRTNVLGTATILEALKNCDHKCTGILITSDKAYDNVEWLWGYRENDTLGGKDVYSGSKGAAELIIKSFWHSFLKEKENVTIGVARAGNVIGGGDWAKDRIVVDIVDAILNGSNINLRSPDATRPWQHVLEPLSGYLLLGAELMKSSNLDGEAFNFGPKPEIFQTVAELSSDILKKFDTSTTNINRAEYSNFNEAQLLKLNCDKAQAFLKWSAVLSYKQCVDFISEWYLGFKNGANLLDLSFDQIKRYQEFAQRQDLKWSK